MAKKYDVIVVGAGAAGVGMGVVLQHLGVSNFTLVDRHEVGASFLRWPKEMRFITPSFASNGFGLMDLNAVAIATSPAHTLSREHPNGQEVEKRGRTFYLSTSAGELRSRFLIWAAGALALLFAVPVYLAYYLADWAQPLVDGWVITPLVMALMPIANWSPLLFAMLAGDYGLLTLGWYSFLWAFPVVLFISISVALTDESGLKDRVTAALDPWLRKIGLNGRDLIPVLSGFGCNVVAVFQSRACSACTRGACVSMIAFGSACSYQIGASLSLFSTAGSPWLFAPYLVLLFF